MKKELKNLTPEMVEELRNLGVTFEVTHLVWQLQHYKDPKEDEFIYKLKINNPTLDKKLRISPAPNLQEVLDKLPKNILILFGFPDTYYVSYSLSLNIDITDKYTAQYIYLHRTGEYCEGQQGDENPLIAAYELLKWVATNHTEEIKEK